MTKPTLSAVPSIVRSQTRGRRLAGRRDPTISRIGFEVSTGRATRGYLGACGIRICARLRSCGPERPPECGAGVIGSTPNKIDGRDGGGGEVEVDLVDECPDQGPAAVVLVVTSAPWDKYTGVLA